MQSNTDDENCQYTVQETFYKFDFESSGSKCKDRPNKLMVDLEISLYDATYLCLCCFSMPFWVIL